MVSRVVMVVLVCMVVMVWFGYDLVLVGSMVVGLVGGLIGWCVC